MKVKQHWGDMLKPRDPGYNSSSCVLNMLQVPELILWRTKELGIIIVKFRFHECIKIADDSRPL